MLVKHVISFIEQLNQLSPLIPCDSVLFASLSNRFSSQDPDKLLDEDDTAFLLSCYGQRSRETTDTENDCLLNANATNQLWSGFAQDLAVFTGMTLHQILCPAALNLRDPNDYSDLTETTKPINLYLDGGALYRKRSLCGHLIKNEFELSTYKDSSSLDLSSKASSSGASSSGASSSGGSKRIKTYLTVEVLTRLKSCSRENSQFTIDGEIFSCFWDFLEKKSFPRLKDSGEMPLHLLPHLLRLIEQYYILKNSQSDYLVFKKAVTDFLELFVTEDWEYVNYLYGEKIVYQDREHYLLDLLIDINQSKGYHLDELLNALAVWLYQFNPALKSTHPSLADLYTHLVISTPSCSSSSSDSISAMSTTNDKLHQCFSLILSLLTTSFDAWPFGKKKISLWDRRNVVFHQAAEIYELFSVALKANNEDALLAIYNKHFEKYFNPPPPKPGTLAYLTNDSGITRWHRLVGLGKLSAIDINWREPEIILQALLFFKPVDKAILPEINSFLDELIRTCSQRENNLLKRFRINCLFCELINKMIKADRVNLNRLLPLYVIEGARLNFLDNCTYYIRSRLEHLPDDCPIRFNTEPVPDDARAAAHFSQVNGILQNFKISLSSSLEEIMPGLYKKLFCYLTSLSRPLLTAEEKEWAEDLAKPSDYLCSPT